MPWPEPAVIPEFDELDAGKVMHLCLPPLIEHNEKVRRMNAEFRAAEASPEAGRLLQALFEEVSLHWAEERVAVEQLETWARVPHPGSRRSGVGAALDPPLLDQRRVHFRRVRSPPP